MADISKEQPSKAVRILLEFGKSGHCIPGVLNHALRGFAQLFQLDAPWVAEKLVPLMRWGEKPETPGLWQGYLWAPRLWPDLLASTKEVLLSALANSAQVGEQAGRNLRRLFAFACLEMPDGFSDVEIQTTLRSFTPSELSSVASALKNHLENAGDGANKRWAKRVWPFIENNWPLDDGHKSPTITNTFAEMTLKVGDEFSNAVAAVTPYLTRVNERDMLPYYFKKNYQNLIEDYPEAVLQLLHLTAPEQDHVVHGMREILDKLA